jgi:uncharacterized surface protein with fasciclin (FAS1) repeats
MAQESALLEAIMHAHAPPLFTVSQLRQPKRGWQKNGKASEEKSLHFHFVAGKMDGEEEDSSSLSSLFQHNPC